MIASRYQHHPVFPSLCPPPVPALIACLGSLGTPTGVLNRRRYANFIQMLCKNYGNCRSIIIKINAGVRVESGVEGWVGGGATVSVLAAAKVKVIVGREGTWRGRGRELGCRCQRLIMPSLRGLSTWHTFK